MMRSALLLLAGSALIVAGCAEVSGERDLLAGHMVRNQPYAGFPQPSPGEALPLVMIVGPPGATECWAVAVPETLPWRGPVDQDRTVIVATRGLPEGALGQRYECAVRDPGNRRTHLVTRYVAPVELPLDPEMRRRRHAQQIEGRRQQCERDPAAMRRFGVSCDVATLRYLPERRILPLIVHVGEPDERAQERWDELRVRMTARCETVSPAYDFSHEHYCALLDDAIWAALVAADLEHPH